MDWKGGGACRETGRPREVQYNGRSGGKWSGHSSYVLQHFTWDEGEKDRNETEGMTLGVGSGQEEIGCASRGRGTGGPFLVISKQSSV